MNQRWKVILTFVGVFVAGALCGGPIAGWLRDRQMQNRPAFAERIMHRFEKELDLTAAQKEKIRPILLSAQKDWKQVRQDNVKNLAAVVDRMHVELAAELSAAQRTRLEELRKEFRARSERFRGRVQDGDRRLKEDASPSAR